MECCAPLARGALASRDIGAARQARLAGGGGGGTRTVGGKAEVVGYP